MDEHHNHRQRKKEQFRVYGLDAFADHEVLELLLYYALPRVDTNPIAHRLLDHFGTLEKVFSASAEELSKIKGVGENAALLIALFLPLCRRIHTSMEKKAVMLHSPEQTDEYFQKLFFGEKEEVLYEACLDKKGKLLRCFRVSRGGTDSVDLNMRRIVENALNASASAVILAHNHPSGIALPSPDDNATTLAAFDALRTVGVALVDHIIVADGDSVSLCDNGLIPHMR